MGTFESLAHTADVGFQAHADDLDDLFATAALAMLSVEYDPSSVALEEERPVTAEGFVPGKIRVEVRAGTVSGSDGYEVDGWAEGAPMGEGFVQTGPQLKAVTLHALSVVHSGDGYSATVYLDV